jgi:hypothetical protein
MTDAEELEMLELEKAKAQSAPAPAPAAPAGPGYLESLGRGALQGGTLGFSDEIGGAIEAALEDLRGTHENIGKLYAKHRDESRAANAAAQQANPITYGAGQVAGGLAPALLTSGASLPEQLAAGAAMGGLGALGEADKLDEKALGNVGEGIVGGAAGAGLGNLAAKGAGAIAKPAAEALEANAGKFGEKAAHAVEKAGEYGVMGSLLHGNIPGAVASLAAPTLAPAAGKVAAGLAGTLGRVGKAAASNPALLGRAGAVLANAAKAGPQALSAAHFALAQKDPDYQKRVLAIQNGEHPELDAEE